MRPHSIGSGRSICHNDAASRYRQPAHAAEDRAVDKIARQQLITRRFPIERIVEAYDTFGRAADTSALKVIIEVWTAA